LVSVLEEVLLKAEREDGLSFFLFFEGSHSLLWRNFCFVRTKKRKN